MWFLLSCLSVLRSFVLFFLCGVVIAIVRGAGRCCYRRNTDIVGTIEVACTGRWGRGFHPVQIGMVVQQGRSSLSSLSCQLRRGLGVVVVVVVVAVVVGVVVGVGVVVVGIVVVVGVAVVAVVGTVVAVAAAVVVAAVVDVVVVGGGVGGVAAVEIVVVVAGSVVGAAPVAAEPSVPVSSLQLDLGSRG